MASVSHKVDHAPLLAPGRHFLTMEDVAALCVQPFEGQSRLQRERLFEAFGQFVLRIVGIGIPCSVIADGSFFTKKPEPDDVDVIVCIESSVYEALDPEQQAIIEAINDPDTPLVAGVDSRAVTTYPRGHKYFGTLLCGSSAAEAYGIENGRKWLKGCAVLRLLETNVGHLVCR